MPRVRVGIDVGDRGQDAGHQPADGREVDPGADPEPIRHLLSQPPLHPARGHRDDLGRERVRQRVGQQIGQPGHQPVGPLGAVQVETHGGPEPRHHVGQSRGATGWIVARLRSSCGAGPQHARWSRRRSCTFCPDLHRLCGCSCRQRVQPGGGGAGCGEGAAGGPVRSARTGSVPGGRLVRRMAPGSQLRSRRRRSDVRPERTLLPRPLRTRLPSGHGRRVGIPAAAEARAGAGRRASPCGGSSSGRCSGRRAPTAGRPSETSPTGRDLGAVPVRDRTWSQGAVLGDAGGGRRSPGPPSGRPDPGGRTSPGPDGGATDRTGRPRRLTEHRRPDYRP